MHACMIEIGLFHANQTLAYYLKFYEYFISCANHINAQIKRPRDTRLLTDQSRGRVRFDSTAVCSSTRLSHESLCGPNLTIGSSSLFARWTSARATRS